MEEVCLCEGYQHVVSMRPKRTLLSRNWRQGLQAGSVMTAEYETTAVKDVGAAPTKHHDRLVSSSAGVDLAGVDRLLDELYPPSLLAGRNALSRTDGYWSYVRQGKEPPAALTYGEFDLHALAQLLETALQVADEETTAMSSSSSSSSWRDCVFTDIGSGTGRMVLAAAALHPWRLCRGIELLPGLHNTAVAIAKKRDANIIMMQQQRAMTTTKAAAAARNQQQAAAPVELCCGSFDDEVNIYFGDSDFIFSFSTCMNGPTMDMMGRAIRRQCRPGTMVVTTDYRLPETDGLDDDEHSSRRRRLELLREIPTACQLVGGECTAFLHRVVEE
jgi:hypothetical protein